MQKYTDYVMSHVKLNSYSSSEDFVGFCFSENGWGEDKYIEILCGLVKSVMSDFRLVSSLNISLDLSEHSKYYSFNKDQVCCRDFLVNLGVIGNINNISSDFFHFNDFIDDETLKKVILYQTSIGGAVGHAFLVDLENEIIIYPHDDCGLGFIISGEGEKKSAKLNFLKEVDLKYKDLLFKFF